jgi:hypothetical protein
MKRGKKPVLYCVAMYDRNNGSEPPIGDQPSCIDSLRTELPEEDGDDGAFFPVWKQI